VGAYRLRARLGAGGMGQVFLGYEQRQADERSLARREAFADRLAEQQQHDRIELYQQGFLTREVQAYAAEQEQMRRARIVELRQARDKLETRPGGYLPAAEDVDLAAVRAEAAAWNSGPCRRMRQWSERSELARSSGVAPDPRPAPPPGGYSAFPREITRTCDATPRLLDGDW
jgi:hypothetical protein